MDHHPKTRDNRIHGEDNTSSCSSLLHHEAPVQRHVILMVQAPRNLRWTIYIPDGTSSADMFPDSGWPARLGWSFVLNPRTCIKNHNCANDVVVREPAPQHPQEIVDLMEEFAIQNALMKNHLKNRAQLTPTVIIQSARTLTLSN